MAGPVAKNAIVQACLDGIENAQNSYNEMSGSWVCWGPEYFITTEIARSLATLEGTKYITLENGTYAALTDANATGRGKFHPDIRIEGRVDIVLWWANGTPRAVIEVKNNVRNKSNYESDIKRIQTILARKRDQSSLKFGVFAFYTDFRAEDLDKANEQLTQRLSTIKSNVDKLLGPGFTAAIEHNEVKAPVNGWAWAAVCVVISRS
ncbi:hypothetical protein [Aquitalea sp. USM4]|uniref:hypothetical protein n=1 Tax=Aquitalea sp. USM4 TaxID=1590041 RepID=UPI00103C6AFC|nr:hypothetical protein [Aquitalea sp. USM4]QBJ79592.1 hypothetical protein DKK66_16875 [Aquitalea sp. USM4]